MNAYRPTSDPVVKTRYCQACQKPIVGIIDRGLEWWLDVDPLSQEIEAIYHAAGRPTFHVQPRPERTAWLDWRNPATSTTPPERGVVLVQHAHASPGPNADPPTWLTGHLVSSPDPTQGAMF